ncbi:response regulator [Rhodococcus sp. X156]|uniref:response regulator n=1 Tax=Rhodococcus sp. X156 TaxID=2499145 RepID=UPI000FD953CA|nr:response regulator [Rhodococcus sp. X156]
MTVRAIVIDDSSAMRMILRRIVTKFGFEVSEAVDGRDALERLAAADPVPDVALVDWNMPEMNGLELIQALRADPRYAAMTLLMVTTESEQSQVVRALAAGAHEYLVKPFTPDALAEKLQLLGLVPARA